MPGVFTGFTTASTKLESTTTPISISRMFDKRCAGYETVGYTILLPASALPGWPVEVPLPIDPVWKNAYAASVRRLIRDGVDAPLGKLFVTATRTQCLGSLPLPTPSISHRN